MTEDDTFNALLRPSSIEMKEIYGEWWNDTRTAASRDTLFIKHGWTFEEWRKACRKEWRKLNNLPGNC